MDDVTRYRSGLSKLRAALASKRNAPSFQELIGWQQETLDRYQPIFSPENIPSLSEEDFRSFLLFKNNHHWQHIHRQSGMVTADMGNLRKALGILVDESRDLRDRLDVLLPKRGGPMVKGLNRAVITPILFVSQPQKYGVWNSPSEAGMRNAGLFPDVPRDTSFAERYIQVNQVLLRVANDLGIDLWTLDALWWEMKGEDEIAEDEESEVGAAIHVEASDVGSQRFGLEQHLHEFLRDNWTKTALGAEWDLYEEDGELVGYQYPCTGVGYADLVAKHKREPWWLVVELKRNQSSDTTIGQVLRYMGWVGAHLAQSDETVKGLIISHKGDKKLHYALKPTTDVDFMTYEVDFRLKSASGMGDE